MLNPFLNLFFLYSWRLDLENYLVLTDINNYNVGVVSLLNIAQCDKAQKNDNYNCAYN